MALNAIDLRIIRPAEDHWPGILRVLETANFHAIGSPEMPIFPLSDCFVALVGGEVAGVAGYRILDAEHGKTTLLAVHPTWRGTPIGEMLQRARLGFMQATGIQRIYTNTDDQRVARWLCRRFGFKPTGDIVMKTSSFGNPEKDRWATYVLDVSRPAPVTDSSEKSGAPTHERSDRK